MLPGSTLLLITSDIWTYAKTTSALQKPLLPVAQWLEVHRFETIHAHVFSNGGAWQLVLLSQLLHKRCSELGKGVVWERTHPLPISTLVLDSAPGSNTASEGIGVSGATWRKQSLPIRYSLNFAAAILGASSTLYNKLPLLPRTGNILLSELLNDPGIIDPDAKRLYIYSKQDSIVNWRAVERNAQIARKLGRSVRVERFEGSSHVAHAKKDSERYWTSVQALMRLVARESRL
ncbi:hypothetical protein EMMF5_004943 [Cystobasidiomycetes sp. EMM_F5]